MNLASEKNEIIKCIHSLENPDVIEEINSKILGWNGAY